MTGGRSLRVALIGCGRIGAHTSETLRATSPPGWIPASHAEAIRSTAGLELVAVCDAQAEAAKTTAAELGAAAFTNYREMIASLKPDIVSIATRTEGRCDMVEFAARSGVRGLHVEKPLGRSPEECRRALRAVEQAGIPMTYGATRRWHGVFRAAKRMADAGEIGEPRQISIEFGRSALLWTHAHSFDLIAWFSGGLDPAWVQASCQIDPAAVQERRVDADPIVEGAMMHFDSGINAVVNCAPGKTVRLAGDNGILTVAADGTRLLKEPRIHPDRPYLGEPERIPVSPECSATQGAFRALRDAVQGKGETGITPRDVLLSNLLGFACAWSSLQGGRRITLEEVPDDLTITGRQGNKFA